MTTTASTAAADGLAVVVTEAGSFTPSGHRLTGPVDSIDKLGTLLEWAWRTGKLAPTETQPIPQVWIIGPAACANLGWRITVPADTDRLSEADQLNLIRTLVHRAALESLPPLIAAGWTIHGAGQRLQLTTASIDVEIVIATTVNGLHTSHVTAGTDPADPAAAAEVARRIREWAARFHTLPAGTAAATGAALADRIRRDRQAHKRGLIAETAVDLPAAVDSLPTRVQPPWGRYVEVDDIDGPDADYLVHLDQDEGLLATAGMLTLPVGEPTVHTGPHAQQLAAARKRGAALWQITLPALTELDLPAMLPPPDPRMRADEPVQVWVTTPGLDGLLAPTIHGGLGLDIEALHITTAITWTKSGRVLDKWAAELRDALDAFTAAGDTAMARMVSAAATDYLARLGDPQAWQGEGLRHHLQPVWWAAICEYTRFRSRRAMLRISREFRIHPLTVIDTAVYYAVGADDLSDPPGPRGRHEVRTQIPLTNEGILRLLDTDSGPAVIDAVAALFDLPAPADPAGQDTDTPTGSSDELAVADADTPTDSPRPLEAAAEPATADAQPTAPTSAATAGPDLAANTEPAAETSPQAATQPPVVRKPARATTATEFSGPAAVLDTTGAWLADGTCVPLPQDLVHAGDVVAFSRTLRLGHRISPGYAESGQVWITDALAQKFGIDTTTVDRKSRDQDLRSITAALPFVTLAVAAGWCFGNQPDDRVVSLSNWTRVWHRDDDESKTSTWLVLMAGLGDDPDSPDPDMPILLGDPNPETIARRLKRFADTLDFPWKISGPTTGLDLVKEARPKTYGPAEWREKIWARTGFELPPGIGVIARDFAWSRKPTPEEASRTYVHAYDRGGSYVAGLAGLELPIGEPEHKNEGEWQFDPRVPAFILTQIPPTATWELPYVLSPAGRDFGDTPQWVPGPQFERALALGYDLPILEAWIWPSHARLLREWANRFSTAARVLDTDNPDDQAVRSQVKVARVRGYGMLASQHLADAEGPWAPYRPEVWFLGVSKAAANITHFLTGMYDETGAAILAIDKDTIVLASDDPNPVTAWPMGPVDAAKAAENPKHRPTLGRGFGQWKPEASGLLDDQARFFDGGPYKGKRHLTPYREWIAELGEPQP
ncbi:hypothetical protein IU487_32970 [Nocardia puris]|uniref:hypothetical protein n=1 Tax=Nocardia puris TaxID=208602 RepID=UPI0018959B6D|nr:hypothetical protein [Nocardia puris]MBF6215813.1 hypothetical protein [Nocardia puris]